MSRTRLIFYLITFAAIIVVSTQIKELKSLRDVFAQSDFFWLLAIILAQWLSYHFWALNYQEVLHVKGLRMPVMELFPMVLIVQFINQAIPSANVAGQAFFIFHLRKYNVPPLDGISRAILELATLYVAFGLLFILATVIMIFQGVGVLHPVFLTIFAIFAFFVVLFAIIFIALQRSGSRSKSLAWLINRLDHVFDRLGIGALIGSNISGEGGHISLLVGQFRETLNLHFLREHWRVLARALWWQLLYLCMNALTIYFTCYALSIPISMAAAFVIFMFTKMIFMIAFVPGGIGIYEFVMTLLLVAYGIPTGTSLSITLLSRLFTFWLPLPIGWYLYRRYMKRHEVVASY